MYSDINFWVMYCYGKIEVEIVLFFIESLVIKEFFLLLYCVEVILLEEYDFGVVYVVDGF